jgi:hypothetical protein
MPVYCSSSDKKSISKQNSKIFIGGPGQHLVRPDVFDLGKRDFGLVCIIIHQARTYMSAGARNITPLALS